MSQFTPVSHPSPFYGIPWIVKELDTIRKLAGVSVETYLRFVMSLVLQIRKQFLTFSLFCNIFCIQTVILKPKLVLL